jgi:hypothetical protein
MLCFARSDAHQWGLALERAVGSGAKAPSCGAGAKGYHIVLSTAFGNVVLLVEGRYIGDLNAEAGNAWHRVVTLPLASTKDI